jgi:hypothetical protein
MKSKVLATIFLSTMFFIAACDDQGDPIIAPGTPAVVDSVSFANDITPIFNSKGCAGCHGGSGGLTVLPYTSLLSGGSHGAVITVGNGEGSILVKKLRGTAGFGDRMPQGSAALSEADIQKFVQWINQGAKNN